MEGKLYIKKFIRDDGETLSFDGEEIYLAENNTLLVRANPATTAVEYTESDGGEMIRQRNATYVQTIKGLIVPKTSTYWDLETRLSLFFKINHTYKIIYVKKDGSMFAISDAWISMGLQIVPVPHETYSEWSIDFTIGNNGWREYMEDESGKEIYANNVVLPLISAASGGEVWESVEGEEISGEGSTLVLNGTKNGATITSLEFYGDAEQQTYTGKNLFSGYTKGIKVHPTNGSQTSDSKAASSDYIPLDITGSNKFVISGLPTTLYNFVAAYNASNVFLGRTSAGSDGERILGSGSFTLGTPQGSGDIAYIRVTVYENQNMPGVINDIDNAKIQLEIGSTATSYEPYVGSTYADITPAPNPDYPQDIHIATGSQSITISDGVNSQSYTVDLGAVELAKIGTFQDYIYKSGDDWYVHKDCGKVIFNGAENWSLSSNYTNNSRFTCQDIIAKHPSPSPILSNYFTEGTAGTDTQNICVNGSTGKVMVTIANSKATTAPELTTWLSTHNTTVYYVLATTTDTKITDNTLIGELEALAAATGYNGQTIITASPSGTNLPAILAVTMQNPTISGEVWDNVGTEWEMGNGGVQTVNIASTQTIYPVWVVEGPCINPKLQNNTTDTIAEFDGTVATGQTLTVDFEAGTAYLDSALVTRYVAGIVSFAPGENMAGFNSDGGATQESTISWNNIIN